ncbi:hypothetical protein Q1M65_13720 (plasmid) [Sinorhizobium meliloti]|nr:hypothetical protein Q1M65_13720 [Sinorhizobium meliloti]
MSEVDGCLGPGNVERAVFQREGHVQVEIVGNPGVEAHVQGAGKRVAVADVAFVGYDGEANVRPEIPERGSGQIAAGGKGTQA